jgi:hypothetical protein
VIVVGVSGGSDLGAGGSSGVRRRGGSGGRISSSGDTKETGRSGGGATESPLAIIDCIPRISTAVTRAPAPTALA